MVISFGVLDWALVIGVCALGWFLAVRFKAKYNVRRRDFFAVSFYVAGLAASAAIRLVTNTARPGRSRVPSVTTPIPASNAINGARNAA